jgi:sphingosine kinase
MKVDLFSMTQGGKRSLSFMSQALGLMADLDLGTEHLRWMGDTRFMVGLLKGSTLFLAFSPRHILNCSLPSFLFFLAPYFGG